MPYIGNTPTEQNFAPQIDYFDGTGSQTSFTLSRNVASVAQVIAVVNNVVQKPGDAFTVLNNVITFTGAPSAGTGNIYVYYTTLNQQISQPGKGTVGINEISDDVKNKLFNNTFAFRNRIINGAMMIDQRNAGGVVTINTAPKIYTLDRWHVNGQPSAGVFTIQQSSVAPVGFKNSALLTVTTASTPTSGQYYLLCQRIEGYNVADLSWGTVNATPITISFWVRSSVTGLYSGAIMNNTNDRSYPFTYTINAANTFEYKTITVAGDITGAWTTDNSAGMYLWLDMGCNSSVRSTAGTWMSGIAYGAAGSTQLITTNGATFYITGVQLEKGTVATSFEYRNYGTELALCQRYYEVMYGQIDTGANGSGTAYATWFFKQQKRAAPTITQTGITIAGQNTIDVGAAQWYSTAANQIRVSAATATSEL